MSSHETSTLFRIAGKFYTVVVNRRYRQLIGKRPIKRACLKLTHYANLLRLANLRPRRLECFANRGTLSRGGWLADTDEFLEK